MNKPQPGWEEQQPQPPQYQPPPITIVNQITVSSHSQATAVASARSGGSTGCLGCLLAAVLIPMLCGGGCLMFTAIGANGAAARRAEQMAQERNKPQPMKAAAKPAPELKPVEDPGLIKIDEPPKNPRLRTWRNHDGKFFAEAELVRTFDDKAELKTAEGKKIEVIVPFLHADDRQYVKDHPAGE